MKWTFLCFSHGQAPLSYYQVTSMAPRRLHSCLKKVSDTPGQETGIQEGGSEAARGRKGRGRGCS